MRIFVIGFMGAGKTTFARQLAISMKLRHVDLDARIESKGLSIVEIFAQGGESYFREIETATLHEIIAAYDDAVFSLGGGAACSDANIALIKAAGTVVYLKLPVQELVSRLESDRMTGIGRPMLRGTGSMESQLKSLLRVRERFYARADIVVDPRYVDPTSLADILNSYRGAATNPQGKLP
jgi:shikimate kinase